ncbi:MAG: rubrerythrin, partial [Acidobacteria bacterium]
MRNFNELTEPEILALAISLEEEDERIFADFAHGLRESFPGSAAVFEQMRTEESSHRRRLQNLYQQKFGEHIPLIRRQDVKGFVERRPVWLRRPLSLKAARSAASSIEQETGQFYERAAARTSDASIRRLLDDLAQEERSHQNKAEELTESARGKGAGGREKEAQRKLFLLQIVQPGLAGLMDGSVSTLAPVFAAAFATHSTHAAFLVGLAAS